MTLNENDPAAPSPLRSTDGLRAQTLHKAQQAVLNLDERMRVYRPASKDKRVLMACDGMELVAKFVFRCLPGKNEPEEVDTLIRDAVEKDEKYVKAFADMLPKIEEFDACLVAIDKVSPDDRDPTGTHDELARKLTASAVEVLKYLQHAVGAFTDVVNSWAENNHDRATKRASALRVADEIRLEVSPRLLIHEKTDYFQDELKKVAGDVSAEEFSVHYADYANLETKRADRLRKIVAGLLVAIAIIAVVLNLWLAEHSLGTELIRLSATIPIAALAAYFAGESSKHRKSAKRARELAMAMHTVRRYAADLGDKGAELRHALGMRVYGPAADQTEPLDESLFGGLPKAMGTLEEVIRGLRETLEKLGNRS